MVFTKQQYIQKYFLVEFELHFVTHFYLNFRIAKAMRDSETYNRSATVGTAENRNRKTVVRIQSMLVVYSDF